jgi:hypothetical protein
MHRTLKLTVPPAVTAALQQELVALDEVIGLTVQLGAAKKPAGDVLTVHVLNRGADWGFIVGLGVPFLWLKQRFVHRRAPLV